MRLLSEISHAMRNRQTCALAMRRKRQNALRRASVLLAILALSLLPSACEPREDLNRDYTAEHRALAEGVISLKENMARLLQDVKDQASADAVASEVAQLRSRLETLDLQDAELAREMGLERWKKCRELDKEDLPRARKAHEDLKRRIFYLRQERYYGSGKLRDALDYSITTIV